MLASSHKYHTGQQFQAWRGSGSWTAVFVPLLRRKLFESHGRRVQMEQSKAGDKTAVRCQICKREFLTETEMGAHTCAGAASLDPDELLTKLKSGQRPS